MEDVSDLRRHVLAASVDAENRGAPPPLKMELESALTALAVADLEGGPPRVVRQALTAVRRWQEWADQLAPPESRLLDRREQTVVQVTHRKRTVKVEVLRGGEEAIRLLATALLRAGMPLGFLPPRRLFIKAPMNDASLLEAQVRRWLIAAGAEVTGFDLVPAGASE